MTGVQTCALPIFILVIVFDPLAIMMVLAATESLKWEKDRKFEIADEEEGSVNEWFAKVRGRARFWDKQPKAEEPIEEPADDQHTHIPVETYYTPSVPPTSVVEQKELSEDPMIRVRNGMEDLTKRLAGTETELSMYNDERLVSKFDKESGFVSPNAPGLDVSNERPGDYLTDAEKEAKNRWKADNPTDTLKHQRQLLDQGLIDQLPWENLKLQPDSLTPHAGNMLGFGIAFPSEVAKGDTFLRTDRIPSALYKYNGTRWIEVDKKFSDQYAYDDAYINHLITKIDSGEYDADFLSDAERDQIEKRLTRG